MSVINIINSPWAITPEALGNIQDIYISHLLGKNRDLKAIQAELGVNFDNTQSKEYEIVNGVAIIEVAGILAPKMNMFTKISGGSSTEIIAKQVEAAAQDGSVDEIVLYIDRSPGGTVDGTVQLAEAVYRARDSKQVTAIAAGMMASAAVWIGAAANKVYLTDSTTLAGSIGVVSTHVDRSKEMSEAGQVVTEITAGKYKRIDSEYGPLSNEGREVLQSDVNYMYSLFVHDVGIVGPDHG